MKPLKDKVVTFRMEEKHFNKLQEIAESKDRTIAYLVNKICEEYLIEGDNKEDLVFSYRIGQQKQISILKQYPNNKIMKLKHLEDKCKEYKCTILDLLDFLLEILTPDDLERIPAEYASGYLHKKYNIEDE